MSYSVTTPLTRGEDVEHVLQVAYAAQSRSSAASGGYLTEADAGIAAAVEAFKLTLEALGPNWETVQLSVSGHANPGQQATAGWANDTLDVKAYVLTYAAGA